MGEQLSSEQSWQGGRGTLQQNGGKGCRAMRLYATIVLHNGL